MSPVEMWLIVVCALLLAVAAVVLLTWRGVERRSVVRQASLEAALTRLEQRVEELCRRESARETAEAAAGAEQAAHAEHADWVITFDQQEPSAVSTPQVVGTALGEPLIKAAAFSHGVRQALREEKRAHLAFQVRREYRRRRRASRSRARAAQRSAQRSAQRGMTS